MPRNAKRTQKPQAPQNQDYGERSDQIAAQRSMPLPDNRAGVPSGGAAPAPAPAGGGVLLPPAGAPTELDPMAMAMGAAATVPERPPSFGAPSTRANEPVTAGLPIGPGPGPEALGVQPLRADPVREVLEAAALLTGSPRLAAAAARRRG